MKPTHTLRLAIRDIDKKTVVSFRKEAKKYHNQAELFYAMWQKFIEK